VYSSVVLAISLMLAASAFAQTHKFKDHQHRETDDVSRTVSMDSTTDSSKDPAATDPPPPEAPATTDPAATGPPAEDPAVTDSTEDTSTPSVFDAMSDDVCPAVLNPAVVENFRAMSPELVQRCEALRDAPPAPTTPTPTPSDQSPLPSEQNALSTGAPGTVPAEEGNTTGSTQP
jgi:hypothetical protein